MRGKILEGGGRIFETMRVVLKLHLKSGSYGSETSFIRNQIRKERKHVSFVCNLSSVLLLANPIEKANVGSVSLVIRHSVVFDSIGSIKK